MNLAVTGPAWQWRLDGGADAHGLAFGGNLANRVTLSGAATLDSTRLRAASGKLEVRDAAFGQLTVPELTATGGYDSTVALDLSLNSLYWYFVVGSWLPFFVLVYVWPRMASG